MGLYDKGEWPPSIGGALSLILEAASIIQNGTDYEKLHLVGILSQAIECLEEAPSK